jgi:[acyl-carrier-protein] S-malonyltransferase
MSDLAFLFPGQGSQFAGMGQALAAQFPVARQTFAEADAVLGFALSELCFAGPEEELKKTANTQPAILAVSVAAYRVLAEAGHQPAIVAGHSLGEYSALVAAGSLAFSDALRLVRARGQFMQEAVPEGVGAMAALLKLPEDKLDQILSAAAQGQIVTAANFNSPDQIVIAGHAAAVERAMQLAKTAGAKRAILLPVSAPFHCPLMRPAQERLKPTLDSTVFHPLAFPIVNNWQARWVDDPAAARQGLIEQIPNPVRWTETVRELSRRGIKRFVEVGPGAVLIGLCRTIEPALRGVKFGEPADLESVAARLNTVSDVHEIAK